MERPWDHLVPEHEKAVYRINLFDLDAKYADVVPSREVIAYFERLT